MFSRPCIKSLGFEDPSTGLRMHFAREMKARALPGVERYGCRGVFVRCVGVRDFLGLLDFVGNVNAATCSKY